MASLPCLDNEEGGVTVMFFTQWEHEVASDSQAVVLPDGCRDILLVEDACSDPTIKTTTWDDRARTVRLVKGQQLSGFRLCPGLAVNDDDIAGLDADKNSISSFIEYLAELNRESIDLVHEVANHQASMQSVARTAGVSTRTLQRRFKKLDLPKPEYWRLLSRARLAANALTHRVPLVDIAFAHGYSDQSHMTRDFTRWFGLSPAQLRQDSTLLDDIGQLGLGNWTAEQISIK